MNTLVAMLISVTLIGGGTGTQSYTIQGFETIQACRNAQPEVRRQIEEADRQQGTRGTPLVITTCVEVARTAQAVQAAPGGNSAK